MATIEEMGRFDKLTIWYMYMLRLKGDDKRITNRERDGLNKALQDSSKHMFTISRLGLSFDRYDWVGMDAYQDDSYAVRLKPLLAELLKENPTVFINPAASHRSCVCSLMRPSRYGLPDGPRDQSLAVICPDDEEYVFLFKVLSDQYAIDENITTPIIFKEGVQYNEDGTKSKNQPKSAYLRPFPFTSEHLAKYSKLIIPYEAYLEKTLLENNRLATT